VKTGKNIVMRHGLLWLLLAVLTPVQAQNLESVLGNGAVLLQSPSGETLLSVNADRAMIPASLLKIPLAQLALQALGEDFRFETHFYRNTSGDLLIRGLGDPFLVSEEVALISEQLRAAGLQQVRRLVVDSSAFAPQLRIPGQADTRQPYGAINSALAVNFNTVNLAWTANGELISGEAQTPLTPQARVLAQGLTTGQPQRVNLGNDPAAGLRQVHQLFAALLAQAGVAIEDTGFVQGSVDDNWQPFYQHRSTRSLQDNLEGLLHFSNNFIANQLFLTLGAQAEGYPVTLAASQRALQQGLQRLYGTGYATEPERLLMIEGSGLAREQRSSAQGMMHILQHFLPHATLLPLEDGAYRKSGTLTGVYNFAGYIVGTDGLYPFVIMTEQAGNRRAEILRLLQQPVREPESSNAVKAAR